jgi:antitoxin (DNA-binding transcriptional repressor) of toxin-antitoxin stability system
MATFHIPEAEVRENFDALMARVRAGEKVVIESGAAPVAVLRPATPAGRSISEAIARMEDYSRTLGHKPVSDPDFAADMEEIIRNRKPANWPAWDDPEE